MKILFIASRFPYPAVKGDQARTLHALVELSKNHQVHFFCTTEDEIKPDHRQYIESIVTSLHVFEFKGIERKLNAYLTLTKLYPLQVAWFYSRTMNKAIQAFAEHEQPDVIFCQMTRTAPYATQLPMAKVLDYQDAYSLNMLQRFQSDRGPMKFVSYLEYRLMRRYERQIQTQFERSAVVSERDWQFMSLDKTTQVVPIGINVFKGQDKKIKHRLIFSGNLSYFPNVHAITWFCQQVLPLIRAEVADVSLDVVGATPSSEVLALAQKGRVMIHANVPSMSDYLARSAIAVAPMRSGSGTQFKILEALTCNTAVVTTQHGRQGLDFITDDAIRVSDDQPEAFAAEVITLLKDNTTRQRLAETGRQQANQSYAWPQVNALFDRLLVEAVKTHKSRSQKD